MDSGFINRRDDEAMSRYSAKRNEDYLLKQLEQTNKDLFNVYTRLKEARKLLSYVLAGASCRSDI